MASHNIQVINAYYAVVVPAALEIIFLAKAESGVQRNLSVSPYYHEAAGAMDTSGVLF